MAGGAVAGADNKYLLSKQSIESDNKGVNCINNWNLSILGWCLSPFGINWYYIKKRGSLMLIHEILLNSSIVYANDIFFSLWCKLKRLT